ncbi:SulP family inorganic anion transporter [Streptomyces sp. NPDC093228]|uniref:SulP family inorganic anion transporter n=1 Tax=Streptomyces sp. NPDC093228 TaxID=3155070 RepID=UPI0034381C7A
MGNSVCGLLGALPDDRRDRPHRRERAGRARTKASRVLHRVWLLVFTALLLGALAVIPVAALARLFVHAGCKLVPLREAGVLWRAHRGEAVVLTVTAVVIAVGNLFEGVLIGLVLAVARTAWDISHVHVETEDLGAACAAAIEGWAAARGQEAVATTRYTS